MRNLALLSLAASLFALGCGNKDYENCIAREKESLQKLESAITACDKLPDADKKKECVETAKQGHFAGGCDALK